jgi:hypothetical protein
MRCGDACVSDLAECLALESVTASGLAALRLRGNNIAPANVNVEDVMGGSYACYFTNASKYDLKLQSAKAWQYGAFHDEWSRNFDIAPPDLIKSGQKEDPQRPTFAAHASDIDGIGTQELYLLMLDGQPIDVAWVSIRTRRGDDVLPPELSVKTSGEVKVVEETHHPNSGPDCAHHIVIADA